MSFLVALLCISPRESLAAPFMTSDLAAVLDSPPDVSTILNQRSTWDIFWSCIGTIFACTWVSVHPNMPGPNDGRIRIALRRLELMLWAIIAPEMIIFWAMRQWQGARDLVDVYGEHGWTMTHSHFLQMGGFMLAEGEKDISVILPDEFYDLLSAGNIGFPLITEKEIQDRSKGDWLAKGLVIAQTSWFIAQCISRRIKGLTITEIELVTVAFAFLNGIIYFLWWSKPVDATSCVRVYRLTGSMPLPKIIHPRRPPRGHNSDISTQTITIVESPGTSTDQGPDESASAIPISSVSVYEAKSGVQLLLNSGSIPFPQADTLQSSPTPTSTVESHITGFSSSRPTTDPGVEIKRGTDAADRKKAVTMQSSDPLKRVILFVFQRLKEMRGIDIEKSRNPVRTPIFFASGAIHQLNVFAYDIVICIISTLFGLIHCIGWSFVFPSDAERILWQVSAVIISSLPILFLVRQAFGFLWRFFYLRTDISSQGRVFFVAAKFYLAIWWVFIAFIPIYILARLVLLVEAFITLRNLPPGAYSLVNWTEYLPHI